MTMTRDEKNNSRSKACWPCVGYPFPPADHVWESLISGEVANLVRGKLIDSPDPSKPPTLYEVRGLPALVLVSQIRAPVAINGTGLAQQTALCWRDPYGRFVRYRRESLVAHALFVTDEVVLRVSGRCYHVVDGKVFAIDAAHHNALLEARRRQEREHNRLQ